ncbi:unnamed protein product [Nezara viridula]|uniref:Uncharacterized protein n=1 Tax=Nezara viridula TaxID=85310 RepID=A0A9P0HM06_NEZVI|nr:unnamed protein product [Nezara viridula]
MDAQQHFQVHRICKLSGRPLRPVPTRSRQRLSAQSVLEELVEESSGVDGLVNFVRRKKVNVCRRSARVNEKVIDYLPTGFSAGVQGTGVTTGGHSPLTEEQGVYRAYLSTVATFWGPFVAHGRHIVLSVCLSGVRCTWSRLVKTPEHWWAGPRGHGCTEAGIHDIHDCKFVPNGSPR